MSPLRPRCHQNNRLGVLTPDFPGIWRATILFNWGGRLVDPVQRPVSDRIRASL
jgi:hypothetical protein